MAEALRLADELDDIHTTHVARNAAAELRRLHPYETAYKEWHEKTEWVQTTARPGEFGMHRADVMRQRLEQAKAQRDALLEALRALVCNEGLDAYSYLDKGIGTATAAGQRWLNARAAIALIEGRVKAVEEWK